MSQNRLTGGLLNHPESLEVHFTFWELPHKSVPIFTAVHYDFDRTCRVVLFESRPTHCCGLTVDPHESIYSDQPIVALGVGLEPTNISASD